jgi:hypothetical protein
VKRAGCSEVFVGIWGETPHEPWGGAGMGPLGLCIYCASKDGVASFARAAVTVADFTEKIG